MVYLLPLFAPCAIAYLRLALVRVNHSVRLTTNLQPCSRITLARKLKRLY